MATGCTILDHKLYCFYVAYEQPHMGVKSPLLVSKVVSQISKRWPRRSLLSSFFFFKFLIKYHMTKFVSGGGKSSSFPLPHTVVIFNILLVPFFIHIFSHTSIHTV